MLRSSRLFSSADYFYLKARGGGGVTDFLGTRLWLWLCCWLLRQGSAVLSSSTFHYVYRSKPHPPPLLITAGLLHVLSIPLHNQRTISGSILFLTSCSQRLQVWLGFRLLACKPSLATLHFAILVVVAVVVLLHRQDFWHFMLSSPTQPSVLLGPVSECRLLTGKVGSGMVISDKNMDVDEILSLFLSRLRQTYLITFTFCVHHAVWSELNSSKLYAILIFGASVSNKYKPT